MKLKLKNYRITYARELHSHYTVLPSSGTFFNFSPSQMATNILNAIVIRYKCIRRAAPKS